MFKWLELIRFIRKCRKNGTANFKVLTTETSLTICEVDRDWNYGKEKITISI